MIHRNGSQAVLVGVSAFEDEKIQDIPAVANSLAALHAVLTDPELGGWPDDRVEVIRDPRSATEVALRLRGLAARTTGTLLVYFVGHGLLTDAGHLCLAVGETLSDHADLTGLEYRHVRKTILDAPAKSKIVVLDCCYSGRAIQALGAPLSQVADVTEIRGAYTLTAADRAAHVVALDAQAERATSFTEALVEVIREGLPGGPEFLTLAAVYGGLRQRLLARGLPMPNQRGTDTILAFPFARNVAFPATDAPPRSPLPSSIRSEYLATVREVLAPLRLRDRDQELVDLARFCSGDDQPYLWLQADPWAGKTALMSWFVLNPPDDAEVVSFFVSRRLPDAAGGDAFVVSIAKQLSASVEDDIANLAVGHRRGWLASLFESAAQRARESDRVLVLVVDGLDEDDAAGGDASVAALLPRRPPDNMRVVVSSRPTLGPPVGLADDHPLRSCPVRVLSPSPHARSLGQDASAELERALREPGVQREVLGLVTAACGGLTSADLAQLTGGPAGEIAGLLEGALGRILTSRSRAGGRPSYFFGHDTLLATVKRGLGAELDDLQHRLHRWAEDYRQAGWPDDVPDYLLHDYPSLLVATRDLARLGRYATDRGRHDLMRTRTGNDFLAISEIDLVYQLNGRQHPADLPLALRLALRRDGLTRRYENMPGSLPAVWAKIGEYDHAESLARLISDPAKQLHALANLAVAIAENGDRHRAETVAAWISSQETRVATLAWIAELSGDHQRADCVALDPEVYQGSRELLGRLAVAAESAGDHQRAELLARACGYPSLAAERARAAAERGDFIRAELLARAVVDGADRADRSDVEYWMTESAETLVDVAEIAARLGERDTADALIADARVFADRIGEERRSLVLARLAAYDGDWDVAESLVQEADDYEMLGRRWLMQRMARAGEVDRAEALGLAADSSPGSPAWDLVELVGTIAESGDLSRAERLVRSLPRPMDTAEAFARLAEVTAVSDPDRARRFVVMCEGVMGAADTAKIQAEGLIAVLVHKERPATAEDRAREDALVSLTMARVHEIPDQAWSRHVRDRLVIALCRIGHEDRAAAMLLSSTFEADRAWGHCVNADLAARAGNRERARNLLATTRTEYLPDLDSRSSRHAFGLLIRAAVLLGGNSEVPAVFREIDEPQGQGEVLTMLMETSGDFRIAAFEPFALAIDDPYMRANAICELVRFTIDRDADGREHAIRLLHDVWRTVDMCADPIRIGIVLEMVIKLAIELGDHSLARSCIARATTHAAQEHNGLTRASRIVQILKVAASACDQDEIRSMIANVEAAVWHWSSGDRDRELTALIRVLARDLGDHARAERLAGSISSTDYRAAALAEIAVALADTDADAARSAFARAVTTFGHGAVPNPHQALAALAKAADRIGEYGRTDEFVSRLFFPFDRARSSMELAESAFQARDRTTDASARDVHTGRAVRWAVEALAAEVWTKIHWIFQDGSGPLTLAVRLDPGCVDALLDCVN